MHRPKLQWSFYQYQADVTGLQPGTTYSYRVAVNGQAVASNPAQFSFTTPTPGKCSFLSFGDNGANSSQQLALIQRMIAETGIGKVIHLGDLAYSTGTFGEFETNYFTPNSPLMSRLPFFATPGNHEYITDSAAPFLAGHVAAVCGVPSQDKGRYYSFDWATRTSCRSIPTFCRLLIPQAGCLHGWTTIWPRPANFGRSFFCIIRLIRRDFIWAIPSACWCSRMSRPSSIIAAFSVVGT
jgi:hypothetical protein